MEPIPTVDVDLDAKLFQACLREVLHFTEKQVNTLVDDGYECVYDLAYWSYEDITKRVDHKDKLHNHNTGGATYGDMRKKGLMAHQTCVVGD